MEKMREFFDWQMSVEKKDENDGIRKSNEGEKKRVEWRLRCEIRKRRCEI